MTPTATIEAPQSLPRVDPRFAPLEDLTREEIRNERTRAFEGTGNSFLEVPGLIALEAIRVGVQPFPLSEKRLYPVDGQGSCKEVEEPLVAVSSKADGTPVLIRSVLSNDGRWPAGKTIYITGEWASKEESDTPGEDTLVASGQPKRTRK